VPATPRTRSAVAATRAALTLAAALTLPAVSLAQTLPAASYQVNVTAQEGIQDLFAPGTLALGGAQASLRVSPDILLQASAAGPTNQSVSGGARLIYSFLLSGPSAPSVPLLVYAALGASAGGDPTVSRGYAGAGLIATTVLDQQRIDVTCDNQNTGGCPNAGFVGWISLVGAPNYLGSIDLFASATGQNGGYGSAFVDPRIIVDPTFANASAYTIALSPGVVNDSPMAATTAPEPATLALTASGLAGLLLTARRRPRTNA
jgi:hypothetical protein